MIKQTPLYVFLFLIALSIGCALHRTKTDPTKVKVAGTVKIIRDYCGGATPSDDQMNPKPWPAPNTKLYLRKSDTNDGSTITDSIVSGIDGLFSIELAPGTYCVIEPWKKPAYKRPVNNDYVTYNEPCYEKRYKQCDYLLEVKQGMTAQEIILRRHCAWTTPCQAYHGPLPPSAPPTNRGGHQPGHQE